MVVTAAALITSCDE